MLNLRGERTPTKRDVYSQNLLKSAYNVFFCLFLQIFTCGAEVFFKIGSLWCLKRIRKLNLTGQEKKRSKSGAPLRKF